MLEDLSDLRILVADPDPAGREQLAAAAGPAVIGEVGDCRSVLAAVGQVQPQVVILAQAFASHLHGLVFRLVSKLDAVVIMTAITADGGDVWSAMDEGASGYLLRDRLAFELVPAIRSAQAGGAFVSPPLVPSLISYISDVMSFGYVRSSALCIEERLLPREKETLYRLADGQSTEQIAVQMGVAAATVRAYISRLMRKLDLESRGGAIALAYRSGFYAPGRLHSQDRPAGFSVTSASGQRGQVSRCPSDFQD
jgi:DNA-binding NarL/FixJ family response regulator